MPIKLNLKNQTTVTQDFLDMMVDFWKERWKALNNEILTCDPQMRKFLTNKNAVPMSRLKAACTKKDAFDYEKTQLLCLPYEKFWVEDHNGRLFIAGLTKPVILSDLGVKRWQGPRYTIWVSRDVAKRATSADFHWVPEGRELEHGRHPHHNASHPDRRHPVSHPLDMIPNTCWGNFSSMTQNCARAGEVVNLMRTLHLYCSRVNMNSLLTTFSETPFAPLPDAKRESTVEMFPEPPSYAPRRRRR